MSEYIVNIQNPNSQTVLISRLKNCESKINSTLVFIDNYEILSMVEEDQNGINHRMLKNYKQELFEQLHMLNVLGERLLKWDDITIEVSQIIAKYKELAA